MKKMINRREFARSAAFAGAASLGIQRVSGFAGSSLKNIDRKE